MSVAFSPARPRSKGEVTQQAIQKVKRETNSALMMRFRSERGWGVRVSAAGAGKVTPVANNRRNGNWYVTANKSHGGDASPVLLTLLGSSDTDAYICA